MWTREQKIKRAFLRMSNRLRKELMTSMKNKAGLNLKENVELTLLKLEKIIYDFLKVVTRGQRRIQKTREEE